MMVALVAFLLRAPEKFHPYYLGAVWKVPWLVNVSESPWAQLVYVIFNIVLEGWDGIKWTEFPNYVTNTLRWDELHIEEFLWLLTMLSELHCVGRVPREPSFFIGICLAVIPEQMAKLGYLNTHLIVLLDAVVTLTAISCSPDQVSWQEILTNSCQYPWLLLNLRNPKLIRKAIEDVPPSCHKQLILLLFLVLNGLIWQHSDLLAVQYFGIWILDSLHLEGCLWHLGRRT